MLQKHDERWFGVEEMGFGNPQAGRSRCHLGVHQRPRCIGMMQDEDAHFMCDVEVGTSTDLSLPSDPGFIRSKSSVYSTYGTGNQMQPRTILPCNKKAELASVGVNTGFTTKVEPGSPQKLKEKYGFGCPEKRRWLAKFVDVAKFDRREHEGKVVGVAQLS